MESSNDLNGKHTTDNNLHNYNNIHDIGLTEDTSCGFWIIKGPKLQRFANKKAYVFLYGLLGCVCSAAYAYFNGTITTLEKRFKIPSKTTGKWTRII